MQSGKIKKTDKTARVKALEILSFKMRSEKELCEKLKEYGFTTEEISDALSYVKSFGYVNDTLFAEQYAAATGKRKGRVFIRAELNKKGVNEDDIENAVLALEDSEEDIAYGLLIKKAGEPRLLTEKEYAKFYRFLLGRGFSKGSVYKALSEFKNNAKDSEGRLKN